MLALADETAARISDLRGLRIVRPIERGVVDRPQILERLRIRVAEEYPPGEIALEAEILRRLGLIPEDMDYESTVFGLLEEQVAGFYDPDEHALFIASWVPPEMQGITLSHEIVHALQDQHFDIARFTRHRRGSGDAQTAAMAVIEGDATLTMIEDMLVQLGQSLRTVPDVEEIFRSLHLDDIDPGQVRLRAAPAALRETLIFPYREGFGMCARIYRTQGFAGIDALLRQPPASTEQVLHPDKLTARESPVTVSAEVPPPLATDHRLVYDDVLGELGARLFLQIGVENSVAIGAAAGWGGDRAMLFVPSVHTTSAADASSTLPPEALRESVLVWKLVFDPSADATGDTEARQFEHAAVAVLARRYPRGIPRTIPGTARAIETASGRIAAVARSGRTVLVMDRAPADRVREIVRSMLFVASPGASAVPPRS